MTDRLNPLPDDRIRSGRRLAVDIDAPRDRTVCFMVSDNERQVIDTLAVSVNRTRSAVLTRIVTAFLDDWSQGDEPERIVALLREYRASKAKYQIPPNRK